MFKTMLIYKRILFFFLLTCINASEKLYAQDVSPSDSLTRVLFANEKEMFDVITNGNKAAAKKLLGPDYITINADGVMQNKEETIKDIGKFKGSTAVLSNRKIRTYGNVSLITVRAKAYMHSILAADFFYTETWVYRSGQWQFIGWQGTITGLPSWYPVITTFLLLVLLYFLIQVIVKKLQKKSARANTRISNQQENKKQACI